MAALAYVFPPLSGLIAYVKGRTPRMRFHGLQGVLFGVMWPASLYVCSWVTPGATQIAFLAGIAIWLVVVVTTAVGRNPRLPGLARVFESWARDVPSSPR